MDHRGLAWIFHGRFITWRDAGVQLMVSTTGRKSSWISPEGTMSRSALSSAKPIGLCRNMMELFPFLFGCLSFWYLPCFLVISASITYGINAIAGWLKMVSSILRGKNYHSTCGTTKHVITLEICSFVLSFLNFGNNPIRRYLWAGLRARLFLSPLTGRGYPSS